MTEEREFISVADAVIRFRQSLWGGRTPDEILPIPDPELMWHDPSRQSVYLDLQNYVRIEQRKLLLALASGEIQSWSEAGQTPRTFWQEETRTSDFEPVLPPPGADAIRGQMIELDEFDRWLRATEDNPFIRPTASAKRRVLRVIKDLLQTGSLTAHQSKTLCGRWKIEHDTDLELLFLKAERDVEGEYWTVDQALSWILWRDFERLDLNPLGIFVHAIADDEDGALPARYSLRDANDVLIALLRRGVVRAFGGPVGAAEEIRAFQFADATVLHKEAGHVVAFPAFASDKMGLAGYFDRLRILGRDLTKEMPPIKAVSAEIASRADGPFDRPLPAATPSPFDPNAGTMLIGEAALWIGAQGQVFENSAARADRFEQIGVPRLFAALALREVEATGLNVATRRREPIQADVWAECDHGDGQDGKHHFSFIDDIKQNETGGSITLWPYQSKQGPDWCDIRISNNVLLSVFGPMELVTQPQESPVVERPGRGRQKGTGKDDSAALSRVRLLMDGGMPKGKAVAQIAASLKNDGTALSTEKRLLRKLGDGLSR